MIRQVGVPVIEFPPVVANAFGRELVGTPKKSSLKQGLDGGYY